MPPSKSRFAFNTEAPETSPAIQDKDVALPTRQVGRVKETYLDIDLIDLDLSNPRTGALPDIEGMAESIKRKGLLQAIVVVRNGERYTCKVGNRRLAASKILAKENHIKYGLIRALVLTEGDGVEEAILSNTQVFALSQVDRANAFVQLHARGYTDNDIARLFNLARQTVNLNRNRVAELEMGASQFDIQHGSRQRDEDAEEQEFYQADEAVGAIDEEGVGAGVAVATNTPKVKSRLRTAPTREVDLYRPLTSAETFLRKLASRRLGEDALETTLARIIAHEEAISRLREHLEGKRSRS